MEKIRYMLQVLPIGRGLTLIVLGALIVVTAGWGVQKLFVLFYQDTDQSVVIAEPAFATIEEVAGLRQQLPQTIAEVPVDLVDEVVTESEVAFAETATVDTAEQEPAKSVATPKVPVFTSSGAIAVGEPVIVSPTEELPLEPRTVSGTVVGIDTTLGIITVVGGGASTQVRTSAATRFSVAGTSTKLDALGLGDIVRVEGVARAGSIEMVASNVVVTGVFTIVPF